MDAAFDYIINNLNKDKRLFTPGPGPLLPENIYGLSGCFGRNDKKYEEAYLFVMDKLKQMSGQDVVIPMQGSGTLAVEMMISSFIPKKSKVLILKTGHYSDRICKIVAKNNVKYEYLTLEDAEKLNVDNIYEYVVSCVTETSTGLLSPIKATKNLANRLKAKLVLDAVGSIGLESDHYLADIVAFSSNKGLFGLTGAAFIAFKKDIAYKKSNSLYLNVENHSLKTFTGPYHQILSLFHVLKNHEKIKESVIKNKLFFNEKFSSYIEFDSKKQPLLCTKTSLPIYSKSDQDILYINRYSLDTSVTCHLGSLNSNGNFDKEIFKFLFFKDKSSGKK